MKLLDTNFYVDQIAQSEVGVSLLAKYLCLAGSCRASSKLAKQIIIKRGGFMVAVLRWFLRVFAAGYNYVLSKYLQEDFCSKLQST